MFISNRENKTESIMIKLTPTQKESLRDMANKRGINISQLIMNLLDEEFNNPAIINKAADIIHEEAFVANEQNKDSNPIYKRTNKLFNKDISKGIQLLSIAPTKKQTVKETHIRRTWLIRRDLVGRLDRLVEGQGKGYATQLVNQAIEYVINEMEKKN